MTAMIATRPMSPLSRGISSRLGIAASIALLVSAGCGGGGGSGSKGKPGAPGDPAPTPTSLTKFDDAPGVELEIIGVSGGSLPPISAGPAAAQAGAGSNHFAPGDKLSITFTIKKSDGTAWGLSEMGTARILMSGPSFNYQRVLAEQSDLAAAAVKVGEATYRYTFATPIPEVYLPPLNDSPSFGAADGELAGEPLLGGTYTVGMYVAWNYTVDGASFRDVGNAESDFALGTTPDVQPRAVVSVENCNQCHVDLQAHGGLRKDPGLCLLCHTAGSEDRNVLSVENGTPGVSIDFKVMIHKLHDGAHLPSVNGVATLTDGSGDRDYSATPAPYELVGFNNSVIDFSDVHYPVWPNLTSNVPKDFGYSALTAPQKAQEDAIRGGATTCLKCHGDPDGAGPLDAPVQGDLYKAGPSRMACGSCHDDVLWDQPYHANQQTMPANPGACITCHATEGDPLAIVDGHIHPLEDPVIDAGVVVDITGIGGGTGAGGNFQLGDRPSFTFGIEDNEGATVPITDMDASVAMLVGPTENQQVVMPYTGTNNLSLAPLDFAGRLAAAVTTNKGTMGKVVSSGSSTAETITVQFSSATAYVVTGSQTGAIGGGALPASPSTNPTGSSLSALVVALDVVPQTVTVSFSDAQHFTVTGSVSGGMGSGTLPSTVSGSNLFTSGDGSVQFLLSVGTTAFAAGNSVFLSLFNSGGLGFTGGGSNFVAFGIVAGRASFSGTAPAPDRFYDEFIPPAPSYTVPFPMELVTEYLGDGNGSAGQALTAANTPVYAGRQVVSEVTALANATTLSADVAQFARFVDVASTTGYTTAATTFVVLDSGAGVGTREYLQLGFVESGTRMWFKSPARYAHASGAAVAKATLTFRQEGAANQYALTPASGTITSVVPFANGNGIVMTYRTDSRFGYFRHTGDSQQSAYQPPPNDSDALGPEWGEWVGKPYVDGTYTASLWLSRNLQVGLQGEVQTYRSTSVATDVDFLFGASATEVEPHALISSAANCNACHNDTQFHGGGRRGFQSCVLCHSVAGAEDKAQYDTTTSAPTTGVTIDFRTMLHKIHRGEELANASTYTVVGNGGASSQYAEVVFPAQPGGTLNCTKCHGADSIAWKEPADRDYPGGQTPTVHEWASVCSSCHDDDVTQAHIDAQT
ncbi:MAG TPA: hypothetical protein VK824_10145, partial [Planctomycetota bacterium]|nr:hypothetical protein [Planctomycetota bacterium]